MEIIVFLSIVIAVVAVLTSIVLVRRVKKQIAEMTDVLVDVKNGNGNRRILSATNELTAPLAYEINEIVVAYESRLSTVRQTEETNRQLKVILLTLTCLVAITMERTLVLMDEPENHLHPPLLSAFVRALSALLIQKNGLAIISTHSPVILQEVPKNCIWQLYRNNTILRAVRPERETFGENVGVLINDVFGLEVTHSGFHGMLLQMVEAGLTYEEILNKFDFRVGMEARSILRILLANREYGGTE